MNHKIRTIQGALGEYLDENGGLFPCPSSKTTNIGVADCTTVIADNDCTADDGLCRANGVTNPAARVRIGAVPINDLNLPLEYAFDPHKNLGAVPLKG